MTVEPRFSFVQFAFDILQAISVTCGVIAVSMVFMIERLGTILELGIGLRSVSDGPMLGLFILGIMVPWANAKGAMVGGSFGLLAMAWLVGGAQWNVAQGRILEKPLPTSVDGCPYPLNQTVLRATTTMTPIATDLDDEPMILYQITFFYYTVVGTLLVIVVGTAASYFFGVDLERVNPDHIAPMMKR